MKLVCYSNNTAGGLVCNLLNGTYIEETCHGPYDVASPYAHTFCVGDTSSIQTSIDIPLWNQLIATNKDTNQWYGTHLHPSAIPDISVFDEVLVITTNSRLSKLYRWLRYYYGLFPRLWPGWTESDDLDKIDKIRCLSYNVFDPFISHINCKNIEFEDIVSGKFVIDYQLSWDYFLIWKLRNPWLYPIEYKSWAVSRFNEAEYEILTGESYKYL